ncbi:restriction endonuclease type II-like protein [Scheffersomyces xylosifermentans]|uniref:restriction endonuclease type II-like protein n=1 Tax=Scheffersomyces xylosifermentans TaxID=1304137 RepID=UPI00315C8BBB
MSENGEKTIDDQVDTSSFASILAGVQRMRNELGGNQSEEQSQINDHEDVTVETTSTSSVQQRNETTSTLFVPESSTIQDPTSGRTKLHVPTAEPVRPVGAVTHASANDQFRDTRPVQRVLAPAEILVNKSQTGNPLLKDSLMKTTSWKFDTSILSDYYINSQLQILFLSLKYHKLRPEYIWQRLKKLNKGSTVSVSRNDRVLRILLAVVDIDSHQEVIRKLSDFCIKHDLSLVLAWSFEEAGNYIVFAKQLDNSPLKKGGIRGVRGTDYNTSVVEALTGVKSVNKTDVSNLLANYKSVKNIVLQSCQPDSESTVGSIGGLGATKVRNLKSVFSEPFIYNKQYEPLEEVEADTEEPN